MEELLEAFDIGRSLSRKGCPYDNAVAEATFKIIKTEFVWNEVFADLKGLSSVFACKFITECIITCNVQRKI